MNTDISIFKIEIYCAGYQSFGKEWRGRSNNEDYCRLYLISDGEAEIWHHNERFLLSPGKLYLIPQHSNMQYRCKKEFTVCWVHFNIYLYGDIEIFEKRMCNFIYIPCDPASIQKDMLEIVSSFYSGSIFGELHSKGLLLKSIANFFRAESYGILSREYDDYWDNMQRVLNYIDKHLGETITLAKLAEIACYEKTYFSFLFKKLFGVSPMKYIMKKRIDKARFLLRDYNTKISTIAASLGFADAFHFSRVFKQFTGKNPTQFRKQIPKLIP